MTEAELAEIGRVWAAATPGPWAVESQGLARRRVCAPSAGFANVVEEDMRRDGRASDADMRAIAKAPEHIAALLAEVKQLRAAVTAKMEPEIHRILEDTLGHLGKLMVPLKWTREAPTVDGVYWMRELGSPYKGEREGIPVQVSVEDRDTPRMSYFGVSGGDDIHRMVPCEWAGPLVRP